MGAQVHTRVPWEVHVKQGICSLRHISLPAGGCGRTRPRAPEQKHNTPAPSLLNQIHFKGLLFLMLIFARHGDQLFTLLINNNGKIIWIIAIKTKKVHENNPIRKVLKCISLMWNNNLNKDTFCHHSRWTNRALLQNNRLCKAIYCTIYHRAIQALFCVFHWTWIDWLTKVLKAYK